MRLTDGEKAQEVYESRTAMGLKGTISPWYYEKLLAITTS